MCLIVDANLAGLVFSSPPHPDFVPVLDWLQQRDGCLVVGGHLANELGRLEKARRFVVQLQRTGLARQVPAEEVARDEAELAATGLCEFNDSHIVALARVSARGPSAPTTGRSNGTSAIPTSSRNRAARSTSGRRMRKR